MRTMKSHSKWPLGTFLAVSVAAFGIRPAFAQSYLSGDLVQRIDSHIASIPGASSASKYAPPTSGQFVEWSTTVGFIAEGRYREADSSARLLGAGYRVVVYADTTTVPSRTYVLLEDSTSGGPYWGVYIFNPEPLRPSLAIQSPHPTNDSNTGRQSIRMFKDLRAAAFFISGADRCNSTVYSPCSGTTTACSSTAEPYRISDQAHVTDGTFQATTLVLSSFVPGMCFVQVHGFAKLTGDPDLIMSYGTSVPPAGEDKLVQLRDNFAFEDASLTFKVAHVDIGWTRLIATQNTQGRWLNGVADPCSQYASSSSGRFIHVEQAYAKLRDTPTNWNKFSNALANTFQPVSSALDQHRPEAMPTAAKLHANYPNPFNPSTTITFSLAREAQITLEVRNILGQTVELLVNGSTPAGTHSVSFEGRDLPSGAYFVSLRVEGFVQTRSMLLVR